MYSLINKFGLSQLLRKEIVPFFLALTLAEFLYKFGSFILECSSFLVTWYLLGGIIKYLFGRPKEL